MEDLPEPGPGESARGLRPRERLRTRGAGGLNDAEPTNHLDMEAIEALADLFHSFKDFLGYEAAERTARKLGFADVFAYYDWSKNAVRRDMGLTQ